jgi:hypothetical protein
MSAGTGAIIDYTVSDNSGNQRSGTIMATWNTTLSPYVAFSEVSTKDLGNTGTFLFDAVKVGTDFVLKSVQTGGTWRVKVITRIII